MLNFLQTSASYWWPWLNTFTITFLIQLLIIYTYIYIYLYNNIFYKYMYIFINFFLMGVFLSVYQIELFAAFLWLIECSVLFVFLLLLFYFNVKGISTYLNTQIYINLFLFIFIFFILISTYSEISNTILVDISYYSFIDNFYEAYYNLVYNDLFSFFLSFYLINGIEFSFTGFFLLIGSVICVNLFLMNKNIRVQNYNNFLKKFNFFLDFSSFLFLRVQNLTKQSNFRSFVKIYKKK